MEHQTRTKPRFMLSIAHGNLIQCGGPLSSLGLLAWARHMAVARSTRFLFTSWFIYCCNHAIAHWAFGRLGGIHLVGYVMHGTTSPGWYPPVLRWLFRYIPFFGARTDPASLYAARPGTRLAMYLTAPAFTLVAGLGIPCYGRAARIPRSDALLLGVSIWFTPVLIVESIRTDDDLRLAWRELRRMIGRGIQSP